MLPWCARTEPRACRAGLPEYAKAREAAGLGHPAERRSPDDTRTRTSSIEVRQVGLGRYRNNHDRMADHHPEAAGKSDDAFGRSFPAEESIASWIRDKAALACAVQPPGFGISHSSRCSAYLGAP